MSVVGCRSWQGQYLTIGELDIYEMMRSTRTDLQEGEERARRGEGRKMEKERKG